MTRKSGAEQYLVPAHERVEKFVPVTITKALASPSSDGGRDSLVIEGTASTSELDRHGEIISASFWPDAIKSYRGTLLLNHNHDETIGKVTDVTADERGLAIKAEIYRDCIDEVQWNRIERGLKAALSVGIRVKRAHVEERDERSILVLDEGELNEISVVTIPANPSAEFSIAKSLEKFAASPATEPKEADMKNLIAFLRSKGAELSDEATEAQVIAALANLEKSTSAAVLKAYGLEPDAKPEEIRTRLERASGDVVTKAEHDKVVAELSRIKAEAAVDAAIRENKITNAQREWAIGYAEKDAEGFAAFVKAAGPAVPSGTVTKPGENTDTKGKEASVHESEREVQKLLGLTDEQYKNAGLLPFQVVQKILGDDAVLRESEHDEKVARMRDRRENAYLEGRA